MRIQDSLLATVAFVVGVGAPAFAQNPGSLAAERNRIREITGVGDTIRDGTREVQLLDWFPFLKQVPLLPSLGLFVVGPEMRYAWNRSTPYSGNDGGLWAGR